MYLLCVCVVGEGGVVCIYGGWGGGGMCTIYCMCVCVMVTAIPTECTQVNRKQHGFHNFVCF